MDLLYNEFAEISSFSVLNNEGNSKIEKFFVFFLIIPL